MEKIWLNSYAKNVPATLDYMQSGIQEILTETAKKYPERPALSFFGATLSFDQMEKQVNQLANGLLRSGAQAGDRIALLLPNMPQIAVAVYASWRIGSVVVMNNPLYTDSELLHQLNDSKARFLICLDLLVPRMQAVQHKTLVEKIIVAHIRDYLPFPKKQLFPYLARDKHRTIEPNKATVEWTKLLNESSDTHPNIPVDIDGTAALQYTGGTTGVSKGVVLTHRNFTVNCQQGRSWIPNLKNGESVVLGTLPIFHAFGLFAMNMCVLAGFKNVLIPRPEAKTILEAIHKERVTLFPGVPTMFIGILNEKKLKKYNLSSLKICISGAAPCPVEVIRNFEAVSSAQIIEGYGITEASPATCLNPVGGLNKAGSIGLPLPDTEIKIVDLVDENKELAIEEVGELCFKGPQVSVHGYYNMPDETASTFSNGWLYTGDIAKVDQDGYVWIVDRKKDMIIAGGYNVYPRDVEEILYEHPDIIEACVKGVADPYRGETVKAYVVMRPGESTNEKDIINWCKKKLASYKTPTIVEFREELPKSAVGKILRKNLE